MSMNVHAGQVGDETLIAVGLDIQDQHSLILLSNAAVILGAEKQAKLKWHVEAGQVKSSIKLGSRKIMDDEPALLDDTKQFVETRLHRVIHFLLRNGDGNRRRG